VQKRSKKEKLEEKDGICETEPAAHSEKATTFEKLDMRTCSANPGN